MATASQADFPVTGTWADVVATVTAAASVDAVYQNVGNDVVQVFFGGGSAPTSGSGIYLYQGDSVQGNAANVWARTPVGSDASALSVTVL